MSHQLSGELSGLLRERLLIERRDPARDGLGAAAGGWIERASVWAAITPDDAAPLSEGDALAAMPRWAVTIRAGPAPFPGDRVTWGERRCRVWRVMFDPRSPDRISFNMEDER